MIELWALVMSVSVGVITPAPQGISPIPSPSKSTDAIDVTAPEDGGESTGGDETVPTDASDAFVPPVEATPAPSIEPTGPDETRGVVEPSDSPPSDRPLSHEGDGGTNTPESTANLNHSPVSSSAPEVTAPAPSSRRLDKLSFKIGGRVMAGSEVDNKRPEEGQDSTPGVSHELFLRQARVKLGINYTEYFRIRMSIELADALKSLNLERISYLRNGYAEARFHSAARLRFGYFKRPWSRLELRSPGDLPFRGRGLANDRIVEDRNYGDRSIGGMLHGKIRAARLHYWVGTFAPGLRTNGIDAVGRLTFEVVEWLSVGGGGIYKRVENGTGQMVDAGGVNADFRIKYKGLYILSDWIMARDYLVPEQPWSLGIVGYASYDIDLPQKFVLQPVVLAEWSDIDLAISQNDALRAVVGLNVLWRKRFRVMPQVEFIRPLGIIANPWINKDTYYVMVSLQI